jgi:hypothetical protein
MLQLLTFLLLLRHCLPDPDEDSSSGDSSVGNKRIQGKKQVPGADATQDTKAASIPRFGLLMAWLEWST